MANPKRLDLCSGTDRAEALQRMRDQIEAERDLWPEVNALREFQFPEGGPAFDWSQVGEAWTEVAPGSDAFVRITRNGTPGF